MRRRVRRPRRRSRSRTPRCRGSRSGPTPVRPREKPVRTGQEGTMRYGTPGFQAERLVQARDSRGLTQVALAELINRTSSSISRWESGSQSPEPEALETLARALNLPVSFFLRPHPEHGASPMFFRSMASTTQALRRRTCGRLHWAEEIALALQEWLNLPVVDVPQLDA